MNLSRRLLPLLLLSATCIAQSGPLPTNYKTVLTNPTFRVIYVHYGPREKVPVHDHPDTPTIYVYLNDSSPVRIVHSESEKPFSLVRPPTQKGAFRVSPGRIERHSIENLGDLESNFLRVELLNMRLGDDTLEFRGKAPVDLSHNLSATEFSSPKVSVARVICIDPKPCAIAPTPGQSLIVAIDAAIVTTGGHQTTLQPGSVIAIAPQQSAQIAPTAAGPAHILQVLVQPPTH